MVCAHPHPLSTGEGRHVLVMDIRSRAAVPSAIRRPGARRPESTRRDSASGPRLAATWQGSRGTGRGRGPGYVTFLLGGFYSFLMRGPGRGGAEWSIPIP